MFERKHLWPVLRVSLPIVGFGFICGGVYLESLESDIPSTLRFIFMYLLIGCGFFLLLFGIFWSICHRMKSKMYMRHGRRPRNIEIYTVDRPNFYPPAYEESQQGMSPVDSVVVVDNRLQPGLAPPLYTPDSSETLNEDFSHELPPTYQEAVLQNQQQQQQLPRISIQD
ncbi:transmembrane protein 252-like [Chanos chanos]|uniref:Transmembrane protein 252-like n=1 Tax=Chanos chanos TaxID=29144 RepID=A0A6J2UKW4_CHACN|nr:transmembrane protein 252 [Chanos chanos]